MPKTHIGENRIKKIYIGDQKIKKGYVGSNLVFSAAVNLTNLVGSTNRTAFKAVDASIYGVDALELLLEVPSIEGHRYFIYSEAGTWGEFTGGQHSEVKTLVDSKISDNAITGKAIYAATSNSFKVVLTGWGQTYTGYSAGLNATLYMVVDITEYEADTGVTYTADSFWEAIGSAMFYDSKEFEI